MPSQRFRSWRLPPNGIPLRVVLIAPFLLFILVTAGLAGYSYHAVREQMGALTGRLLQETGLQIAQCLDNRLGTARQLVKINVAALRLGILDARNPPALEAYFFQQAATFPTIDGVMLTNEHKDFVAAARREQGWVIGVYDGAMRDGLHNYQADARGHRQQLLWLDTSFDPHDDPPGHPWYAAVRNAGKPLWRLVVGEIEDEQPFLMLSRMAPFDDASGQFQGVTGVSLFLSQVGHFLDGLRISKTGQAFIVDRDGLLIATSTGEPPFYRRPGGGREPLKLRLAAVESQNPITRAASRYLVDTAGGFQRLTGFRPFGAKLDERAYFLQIVPFGDEDLDWRIIMAVPATDVMEQIDADMTDIIALHGTVLALMLLMGLLIAGRIARPILKLNADAKRLARGDFLESCATSLIAEPRQLIDSFKYMATRLRQSFDELRALNQALIDHQQDLDATIARRTEALRRSEMRFRNAFEMTAVGMTLVSPSGRFLQVNRAFCEMLGYSEAELLERSFEHVTFSDDLQKDWNLARQILAGAIPWYQLEKRYIHKQGHIVWGLLSASLVRDAAGEPLYRVSQVQDITERKRAEENLRVALRRVEVLASNLYAGVLLVSNDGRVEFANQAFCDLFDLTETPDDLRGLTSPEMLQKIQGVYASPAEALARIQDIVALGQPVKGEEVAMRGGRLLVRDFIPILIEGQRFGRLWHHVDITERRQMEEALREVNQNLEQQVMERTADLTQTMALLNQEMQLRQQGEERLTQALRAARAGAWKWDTAINRISWSDDNYRVLGLAPGSVEPCYENWLRCVHPEDRAEAGRQVARAMAGGDDLNIEFRVVWPDDSIHWLNDLGKMLYDSADKPIGMYGIQMDITERKLAQEALQASEERYRQIAKCIPDLVWTMDLSGQITYANPTVERTYGWTVDEFLKLNRKDVVTPRQVIHDTALLEAELASMMTPDYDRNQVFRFESEQVRRDGSIFLAEVGAAFLWSGDGQPIGVIGIMRDITERKRVERALRESEAFRRRIFDSSRIPIVVMDAATWKFIDCNPAAVEIYRHSSREETLGQTPLDVSAAVQYDGTPSPEKTRFYIEQALAEGSIVFDWRHQRPSGEVWDAEVHLMHFRSDEQDLLQFSLQDITDRKKTERALQDTLARLEREIQIRQQQEAQLLQARKLEAIGRLTGGIAHDFNNLLTVVKGNLELLRGAGEDWVAPEQSLLIEDALSAARQGTELTAGLLAFSRQQPLRAQRTRVYRIVQALERLLERVLGPTITLRVTLDPAVPDILTDPGQFQAALMNLMLNAQDAMLEGGMLDVRAGAVLVRPNEGEAPVADLTPGQYVVVTVADSGIGMDTDTLARACEPFFTTKPVGKGTGLGLSTVYGFAAQSHGGITIESQPGQGTTVHLFLPAMELSSERTLRETRASSPPRAPAGGAETILVVEDHTRVRRLACRYLRDLGYIVLEAGDVKDALAILETEPAIDLVFSDIVMPGEQNGYDLARWVTARRPAIKCLLATGYHDQAQTAPADDPTLPPVLFKPYSQEQLAQRVRQVL
ncbi:MAG: PAS domain S-box protein, partial [Candidatus Competibacter sp.]|nr:PAS domain S-box protein [Candidatus Competibacter sp.]